LPARSSNPALPAERNGATPRSDAALFDRAFLGGGYGAKNVGFGDRTPANLIQPAVIGFPDDGICRAYVFVSGKTEQVGQDRISSLRNTKRAGQHHGGFHLT